MTVDGQWRVIQLKTFAPNLKYGTIPVPSPLNGKEMGGRSNGNFMVIPKGARNPKGAWEFTKYWAGFTNPEAAGKIATMGGWLPLFPSVVKTKSYQNYLKEYPQFKTFVNMLPSQNVQPLPPVPYSQFLYDTVVRYDDICMRGRISPEEAIRLIEKDITNEIKRRKELGYK
jgi:multiple sugar transport system substrate-binding protein